MRIRDDYLDAADVAVSLLADPAVAIAWSQPSALEKLSVGGLSAHLARQITRVVDILEAPAPAGPPVVLIDHYGRSEWVNAGLDTPPMPARVLDPVLNLLHRLAVRRHGPTAVLRALSRAERAPGAIAAI